MEPQPSNTAFEFVSGSSEILKALIDSKENDFAVGISSPLLGKGMFITGVEDIIIGAEGETRIVLKGCDFTGHILSTRSLSLSEIETICVFSSRFGNPILKSIKRLFKNRLFQPWFEGQ